MSDDPQPIDFSEFAGRKGPPKTRTKGGKQAEDEDVRESAREAAKLVADDKKLDGKTIEELSELAIRRMANVVLRAGDEFLPTTLKEASDTAKTWASVASMEAARKAGKGSGHAEDDPAVKEVLAQLVVLQRKGGLR